MPRITEHGTEDTTPDDGHLIPASNAAGDADVRFSVGSLRRLPVPTEETDSFTFALTHAGRFVRVNSASPENATVPPNSSVAFPIETVIHIVQMGVGQVTIVPDGGVTIRSADGLKITDQYKAASLIKIGTDEWVAIGALEA